jgi:ABC-type glycerol-3-phosphate transport system substrate-binding protein
MQRRRVGASTLLLVLAVIVGLSLLGCSGGEKEVGKQTIRYANCWYNTPVMLDSCDWCEKMDAFMEAHKDEIELKMETAQAFDQMTKIKSEMAAGTLPDLFHYWPGQLKALVKNDLILNVDEYFAVTTKHSKDLWTDSAWRSWSLDGGKTSYGFGFENCLNFYLANESLFEKYGLEYPKTYEELKAVGKVFRENGIIPIAAGSKGGNVGHWWFSYIYYQFAADPPSYMDDVRLGDATFDIPETIKTSEIIQDMAKNGLFPDDTMANGDFGDTVALYNEEKAAMILSFPWMLSAFKDDIVNKSVIIEFPEFPGAKHKPSTFTIGGSNHGLVVSKKAFNDPKKQKVLVTLIDYIISEEMQTEVAIGGRFLDSTVQVDPALVPKLYNMVVDHYIVNGDYEIYPHLWGEMPSARAQEIFSSALDELFALQVSVREFIDTVQESVERGQRE